MSAAVYLSDRSRSVLVKVSMVVERTGGQVPLVISAIGCDSDIRVITKATCPPVRSAQWVALDGAIRVRVHAVVERTV